MAPRDGPDADAIDLKALERLQHELSRPTPSGLRDLITLALFEAFLAGLDRGKLLTPQQMVRNMVSRLQGGTRNRSVEISPTNSRQLALHLDAIQHAYSMATRIYTDYVRELFPGTKSATKGRRRSIDSERQVLLRSDLTHLGKARLLGLPTRTPDDRRRSKDVVRKRITLLNRRSIS
jgi:hypothetical protein